MPDAVFPGGGWRWDADPFQATAKTKGTLEERIRKDIAKGIRGEDVLERSAVRIPLYESIHSIKAHTDGKTVSQIAREIINKQPKGSVL